jgi:hypothetical protein
MEDKIMANFCMIDYYMGVFFNAERINTDEVVKVYKKHLKRCRRDYMSLADLVIAINWMNSHWYKEKNNELCDFYGNLYYQALDTVNDLLKDDERGLSNFYSEIN